MPKSSHANFLKTCISLLLQEAALLELLQLKSKHAEAALKLAQLRNDLTNSLNERSEEVHGCERMQPAHNVV